MASFRLGLKSNQNSGNIWETLIVRDVNEITYATHSELAFAKSRCFVRGSNCNFSGIRLKFKKKLQFNLKIQDLCRWKKKLSGYFHRNHFSSSTTSTFMLSKAIINDRLNGTPKVQKCVPFWIVDQPQRII